VPCLAVVWDIGWRLFDVHVIALSDSVSRLC
jgi:hypothetical protein